MRKIEIIIVIISLLIISCSIANASSFFYKTNCITRDSQSLDYGELKVTTDKEAYMIGDIINITITNIGDIGLGGEPRLRIHQIISETEYLLVHTADLYDLADCIYVNESFYYTWDQKNKESEQVSTGLYEVDFYFVCCGGITVRNLTHFHIQEGMIFIKDIRGGFGLEIDFENIASTDVEEIPCSVQLTGFIFVGAKNEFFIDILKSGDILTKKHTSFGFGNIEIKIVADKEEKKVQSSIIGPFIFEIS